MNARRRLLLHTPPSEERLGSVRKAMLEVLAIQLEGHAHFPPGEDTHNNYSDRELSPEFDPRIIAWFSAMHDALCRGSSTEW
jgi:hypothetical protein